MKRIAVITFFAAVATSCAVAQVADPVLMTVNGKNVTRSEFEYSYNKNSNVEGAVEQKTKEEYAEMYVNYKLKVAAAEEARFDTVSALKQEFLTYRDMQLTPYMVDSLFIDSVAHSLYDNSVERLSGKDLLRPKHILIRLQGNSTETERAAAKQLSDSLSNLLKNGADFDDLARRYSQDQSNAQLGGLLPWIGPGSTLKEFEDAAYSLQKGEVSQPVLTSVGYHLIKMVDRKPIDPYEKMRDGIVRALKQQGIEEASAESKIQKIVAASNGRLTREAVLDSVMYAHIGNDAELKYLIQEYREGLLLYEMSKKEVWEPGAEDSAALEQFYKQNKKKYAWTEPRFKGFIVQAKQPEVLKQAVSFVKKHKDADTMRDAVRERFNKDSTTVVVSNLVLAKKGDNKIVDQHIFGGEKANTGSAYKNNAVVGKKLKQPKSIDDVRSQVVADYQEVLETQWVARLRQKYPFVIYKDVLSTVNNHN